MRGRPAIGGDIPGIGTLLDYTHIRLDRNTLFANCDVIAVNRSKVLLDAVNDHRHLEVWVIEDYDDMVGSRLARTSGVVPLANSFTHWVDQITSRRERHSYESDVHGTDSCLECSLPESHQVHKVVRSQ